jgi:hypothetical protein
MVTAKQRAASRANSQKSTGPRTTAGKAVSRFNALKHGIYAVHQIMFDEKPEDLAELAAEYHELCTPADAKERLLVDALVHNEWRLRRMRRVEAELWQSAYNLFLVKNIDITSTCTSGDAFATDSSTFERLQRVANSCDRAYHRALKELERVQAQAKVGPAIPTANPNAASPKPDPGPAPQPQQSKPASTSSASFHTSSKTPPPAAPQPQPAPPFTGPPAAANPAKTQPSASDPAPRPPQTT